MRLLFLLMVLLGTVLPVQAETPTFTAIAKILVRSPEPMQLAEYYSALGFIEAKRGKTSVTFHLQGNIGALEILKLDPDTPPSGEKTSRTQQDVLAIFETNNPAAVVARAKAAGAKLVERWDAPDRPISVYYVADPENNILGFTSRHHNPKINTP